MIADCCHDKIISFSATICSIFLSNTKWPNLISTRLSLFKIWSPRSSWDNLHTCFDILFSEVSLVEILYYIFSLIDYIRIFHYSELIELNDDNDLSWEFCTDCMISGVSSCSCIGRKSISSVCDLILYNAISKSSTDVKFVVGKSNTSLIVNVVISMILIK